MEVIGIILFCLISIWLGVGSIWLSLAKDKGARAGHTGIYTIYRDKAAKPVKIKCGQRLDWSVEE